MASINDFKKMMERLDKTMQPINQSIERQKKIYNNALIFNNISNIMSELKVPSVDFSALVGITPEEIHSFKSSLDINLEPLENISKLIVNMSVTKFNDFSNAILNNFDNAWNTNIPDYCIGKDGEITIDNNTYDKKAINEVIDDLENISKEKGIIDTINDYMKEKPLQSQLIIFLITSILAFVTWYYQPELEEFREQLKENNKPIMNTIQKIEETDSIKLSDKE